MGMFDCLIDQLPWSTYAGIIAHASPQHVSDDEGLCLVIKLKVEWLQPGVERGEQGHACWKSSTIIYLDKEASTMCCLCSDAVSVG